MNNMFSRGITNVEADHLYHNQVHDSSSRASVGGGTVGGLLGGDEFSTTIESSFANSSNNHHCTSTLPTASIIAGDLLACTTASLDEEECPKSPGVARTVSGDGNRNIITNTTEMADLVPSSNIHSYDFWNAERHDTPRVDLGITAAGSVSVDCKVQNERGASSPTPLALSQALLMHHSDGSSTSVSEAESSSRRGSGGGVARTVSTESTTQLELMASVKNKNREWVPDCALAVPGEHKHSREQESNDVVKNEQNAASTAPSVPTQEARSPRFRPPKRQKVGWFRRPSLGGVLKPTKYTYALHSALQSKADPEVVDRLIDTNPSVLTKKDGREEETPICVLLRHNPNDVASLDKMLLTAPACASSIDRHLNTPLHVACSAGSNLDVVRHLCILHPEAIRMRNFHGSTPLELLQQRSTKSSEGVAAFLWKELQETERFDPPDDDKRRRSFFPSAA